ncbi:MAG: zinc ABC transporter substrate-binding protein [Pseudomonadota bacterium]|nr:zinc ABC transporter substrate-binding protein [Pseudomonadota bacterium]
MRQFRSLLLASTLLAVPAAAAQAEVAVVASIKPVHSLVTAVMDGVGEPGLIIDGAGSPHTYALKPSQAQMLQSADIVFWVGHELEAFLEKPLETLGANARSVELIDAHDLAKLGFREGGAFEMHDHDDAHDHKDEPGHKDEHGHDSHGHDHDHEKQAEHDHGHDHGDAGHDDHMDGGTDPHIWLDPLNAKAMVHEIEEALAAADPENAARYEANAQALMARLDSLITEIDGELTPVRGKGFIVFHDAYRYFENRFGIAAAGSITISPEVMPGAERVAEIQAKVAELGAACVFAEPQFEPKLVATVVEGTPARTGVLDPLGTEIDNGPDLYFALIRGMARSIKTCLAEAS